MLRETVQKAKRKGPRGKSRIKYRGIVEDAAALKVHRTHLWLVLSGRRESKSLLRRYQALKQTSE